MTIPLFTFPTIVWVLILKLMNIKETCLTSFTSKRTQSFVKFALKCQLFTTEIITFSGEIRLKRGRFSDSEINNDNFLAIKILPPLTSSGQTFWNIFGKKFAIVSPLDGSPISFHMLMSHLADTFFKLEVDHLAIVLTNINQVTRSIEALGTAKINQIEISSAWSRCFAGRDSSLIPTILEICRNVERLKIEGFTSFHFSYGSANVEPFYFELIEFQSSWITKDIFIKYFMTCKNVYFKETKFREDELIYIFNKWVERSNIEYLELGLTAGNTLANVFRHVTGATPGAGRYIISGHRVRVANCYELQQENGLKALVYSRQRRQIVFRTDFQVRMEEN